MTFCDLRTRKAVLTTIGVPITALPTPIPFNAKFKQKSPYFTASAAVITPFVSVEFGIRLESCGAGCALFSCGPCILSSLSAKASFHLQCYSVDISPRLLWIWRSKYLRIATVCDLHFISLRIFFLFISLEACPADKLSRFPTKAIAKMHIHDNTTNISVKVQALANNKILNEYHSARDGHKVTSIIPVISKEQIKLKCSYKTATKETLEWDFSIDGVLRFTMFSCSEAPTWKFTNKDFEFCYDARHQEGAAVECNMIVEPISGISIGSFVDLANE